MAPDPMVREVGRLTDIDGRQMFVGVDYDTVTIGTPETGPEWRLTSAMVEEFGQIFVSACWEAAEQAGRLRGE